MGDGLGQVKVQGTVKAFPLLEGQPFVDHHEAAQRRGQLIQALEIQPVLAGQLFGGFHGLGDQVQGVGLVLVVLAQDALGQAEARLLYRLQGAVQVKPCFVQVHLGLLGRQPGLVGQ